MADDLLKGIASEFLTTETKAVNIIEFAEAKWGLNIKLTPVQKFILKCFYSIPLSEDVVIEVPNIVNDRILHKFNEYEFLNWLYQEGRCNTNVVTGKNFRELILPVGRRSGKCRSGDDLIPTSVGDITFQELLSRKNNNENIGIITYDPKTLKKTITSNFKAWSNGRKECFKLTTAHGYSEESTGNHPYFLKRNGKQEFVKLEDLKQGDEIALSQSIDLFGNESIGSCKAMFLGIETRDIIPNCILKAPKNEVALFINSVLDYNDSKTKLNVISKSFADGIQYLLLKFGFKSIISKTQHGWFLSFDENVKPNLKKIAFDYDYNEINETATTDVFWDKIESIISVGVKDTVDLCIEDTHLIGGVMVSHNSTMSSCIASYETYRLMKFEDPLRHYRIMEGATITIMNVAPAKEQSSAVFKMISGNAEVSPILKDRIVTKTATTMTLATDMDRIRYKGKGKIKTSLQCISGGCSANSLRGHAGIVVIMDEIAFFMDNGGRMSADEVYKALTPSTAQFSDGKIVLISSPYAKFGCFYDRYNQSFEEEDTTLMFNMYTALVNPSRIESSFLKASLKRDKSSFMSEFGAEFSDSVMAWIEDPTEFKKNIINPDLKIKSRGVRGVRYYCGIDIAHKNDACAIAIVHKEGDKIVLDYHDLWFSGSSDIWSKNESIYHEFDKYRELNLLRMADIVQEIKEVNRLFPIKKGIFDQSEGFGFHELLTAEGLGEVIEMKHFNDSLNHTIYDVLKTMVGDSLVEVYDNDTIITELISLEGEKRRKGNSC